LRWACKGNEVYRKRYPGKLDYVSKGNVAYTLFMQGTFEEASKVFEEISDSLDAEPWKSKVTEVDPAARYCTPQNAFLIHQMQCICYQQMEVQLGGGKYIGLVSQEIKKYESLWTQSELEKQIKFSTECRAEAMKYAANNKWEEGYEKYFECLRANLFGFTWQCLVF
jgi:hypothetical protein